MNKDRLTARLNFLNKWHFPLSVSSAVAGLIVILMGKVLSVDTLSIIGKAFLIASYLWFLFSFLGGKFWERKIQLQKQSKI